MRIAVIGWYGTETIGDRGILAGLISFFAQSYGDFELLLGSLHPFFSERTLDEDDAFYKQTTGKDIKLSLFDSTKPKELDRAIRSADLVAMGGGPLMGMDALFMVEYAFKKAKKTGKKTALLGCGVGPLFQKKYQRSVLRISRHSDIVILRDTVSKTTLESIYAKFGQVFNAEKVDTSYDPAAEAALLFKRFYEIKEEAFVAVNLREFPLSYSENREGGHINDALEDFTKETALKYCNRPIRLIPMHYFHVGGDDRVYLNSIAQKLKLPNVEVQNSNLSLQETMRVYASAYFNIGMRFHSVVLQTILSGKNYVLDYTEPKKGKIYGFLQDIDPNGFYEDRYIALQQDGIDTAILQNETAKFEAESAALEERLKVYTDRLGVLR